MLVSGTSHFDGVGSDTSPFMLHCYKLSVLAAEKQLKNKNQHTFNCIDYIGRMAEWSKAMVSGTSHFDGVGSNPTPVRLHSYKVTVLPGKNNLFENNQQHIFNCIEYICQMAEWFKVLVSGTSHFNGVGSDTTPVMLHCYKFAVLPGKNNLKKINNISLTVMTIFIGWLSSLRCWSQVLVISMAYVQIPLLSCCTVTN